MRNSQRHFQTVPISEGLKNMREVSVSGAAGNIPAIRTRKICHQSESRGVTPNNLRAIPQSETLTKMMTQLKRVLVVDDEDHIANTLAAMLCDRGYEAVAVYDAVSGLAHCEAWAPDLIIADVVMPEMNGVELAMVVKQLYPSCKVLLVSELAASADFLKDARRNGYDFELLAKPLHLSQLLARVEALT